MLLPFSLECGITYTEFWEQDTDILELRIKAYVNRVHREAHIQGAYIRDALISVLAPMFSKKTNAKDVEYPTKPYTETIDERSSLFDNTNKGTELIATDNVKVDNKELVGRKAILDCY